MPCSGSNSNIRKLDRNSGSSTEGCIEVQGINLAPTDSARKRYDGIKRFLALKSSSYKVVTSNLWKKHN